MVVTTFVPLKLYFQHIINRWSHILLPTMGQELPIQFFCPSSASDLVSYMYLQCSEPLACSPHDWFSICLPLLPLVYQVAVYQGSVVQPHSFKTSKTSRCKQHDRALVCGVPGFLIITARASHLDRSNEFKSS